MPDNITLAGQSPPPEAGASLLFPKLAIYLRLNIETANKPEGSITARASIPGMPEMPLGELGRDAIEQAFAESAAKNLPLVGVVFKAVVSPVQITKPGLASAFIKIEDTEILAATLNILIATS
jgi:hypothetical protein